jgi:magnesium-transporting ATPase (P-type)
VLAVALGHLGDAGVILAVVMVNALIGSFQEGRAERSMAALRQLSALQVRVLRDGAEQPLQARELVPGDMLLLAAGDAVAADARLLEAAQLQVAEAALTGESVPVAKVGSRRCPRPPAWPTATAWSTPARMSPPAAPRRWWWPPARTPRWAASPADRRRGRTEDAAGAAHRAFGRQLVGRRWCSSWSWCCWGCGAACRCPTC